MARQRDPHSNRLMIEGVKAIVSDRTGAVTYRARYSYGSGRHRRFAGKTFKTYDAAEAWLLEQRLDIQRGSHIDPRALTVTEYYDQWMKRMARSWSGARTRTVEVTWKNHFTPWFAGVRLQSVTRPMIQQLVDHLADRGLKATTIRMYMASVASLFAAAQHDGLIALSPVRNLTWPRDTPAERATWSPLQMRHFLNHRRNAEDPFYPVWAFLIATGCRIGEAIAIQWRDLDLDAGLARIHRTYTRGRKGRGEIRDGTKTSDQGRVVPLDGWIVELLRSLPVGAPDTTVFTHHGKPIPYATVQPRWRKAVDAAGMDYIRLHDVRHSVASAMVASGVGDRVVQHILGHASVVITLDTYTHLRADAHRDGIATLSGLLGMARHDNISDDAAQT